MARTLEIRKRVTHSWGTGADHQRFHAEPGDKFEVPGELPKGLPVEVADELRKNEHAAYAVGASDAAPQGGDATAALPAAPTRPPGLAGLVRS